MGLKICLLIKFSIVKLDILIIIREMLLIYCSSNGKKQTIIVSIFCFYFCFIVAIAVCFVLFSLFFW